MAEGRWPRGILFNKKKETMFPPRKQEDLEVVHISLQISGMCPHGPGPHT